MNLCKAHFPEAVGLWYGGCNDGLVGVLKGNTFDNLSLRLLTTRTKQFACFFSTTCVHVLPLHQFNWQNQNQARCAVYFRLHHSHTYTPPSLLRCPPATSRPQPFQGLIAVSRSSTQRHHFRLRPSTRGW